MEMFWIRDSETKWTATYLVFWRLCYSGLAFEMWTERPGFEYWCKLIRMESMGSTPTRCACVKCVPGTKAEKDLSLCWKVITFSTDTIDALRQHIPFQIWRTNPP